MSDLALIWDATGVAADLAIEANDFAIDDGLRTACLLSLFTDRRAEDGDTLPDADPDRRGWWADALPVVDGDLFGSRLWLLERSKQTPEVLPRAETYAREALAWLRADRIADRVEVTASFPADGLFALDVEVWRPGDTAPTRFRFVDAWNAEATRRAA